MSETVNEESGKFALDWMEFSGFQLKLQVPATWTPFVDIDETNLFFQTTRYDGEDGSPVATALKVEAVKGFSKEMGHTVVDLATGRVLYPNVPQEVHPALDIYGYDSIILGRGMLTYLDVHQRTPLGESGFIQELRQFPDYISYIVMGGDRSNDIGYRISFTAPKLDLHTINMGRKIMENLKIGNQPHNS